MLELIIAYALGLATVGGFWLWWVSRQGTDWQEVRVWIADCVEAAEQYLRTADGATKLDYVLTQVELRYPDLLTPDRVDLVRTLIEAAVFRLRQLRVADTATQLPETAPPAPGQ